MAKVKVHVFLKPGVLDVQGKAVEGALQADDVADKEAEVKRMCETLLANTVIESYKIEIA